MASGKRKRTAEVLNLTEDSDTDPAKTPPQHTKPKQQRRMQVFREEYSHTYPCLFAGKKPTFAYCKFCDSEFSVGHGGADDCRRHCEAKKHIDNEKTEKEKNKCQKISSFFVQAPSSSKSAEKDGDSSIRAEVMLVDLVTELNLPLASLDKFNKAVKIMFPDSKIAKNVQCGRSKGTAILKEVAAKTTLNLADRMAKAPFTISTDGSNDKNGAKLFPIVVRTVDYQSKSV